MPVRWWRRSWCGWMTAYERSRWPFESLLLTVTHFIECTANDSGTRSQARSLFLVQRQRKRLEDSLSAHESRQSKSHVADACNLCGRYADGHHGPLVVKDGVGDAGERSTDTVVSRALSVDDRVGRSADLRVDVLANRIG